MPTALPVRDPSVVAPVYAELLGWPVARGLRCRAGGPPVTATRPPEVWQPTTDVKQLRAQFAGEEGTAAVLASTARFDAVAMSHEAGMTAMVWLDRGRPVPCLTDGVTAVLLVAPGTGGALEYLAAEIRTGPDGWVVLPPTPGVRWDTVPWDPVSGVPVPLPDGRGIAARLAGVARPAGRKR